MASACVAAVAFVDPQDAPLFVKRFDGDDSLDLLFVVHSALDVFEESQHTSRRASRKPYLGLLSLCDGFAVYGHLSNTLVKVIVVLDAQQSAYAVPNDTLMEALLTTLYHAYVEAVSNPFLEVGSALQLENVRLDDPDTARQARYPDLLKSFDAKVQRLVEGAQLGA